MSIIYEKTVDFFQSTNENDKKNTSFEIQKLIEESLRNKQDNFLSLALTKAEQENNNVAWNYLQKIIAKTVNTINYQINNVSYVSHMVLLPFLVMSSSTSITLSSLETMQTWLREKLMQSSNAEQLNLAPLLLGKKSASNMTMCDWYQIHKTTSLNLDNRHKRDMYINSFNIPTHINKPHLSFFVLTINQEIETDIPFLQNMDELGDILENLAELYNEEIINSSWLFMPIGTVTDVIANSFDTYQDLIISTFIKSYYVNKQIQFALVPSDENFTFMAWNQPKNLIVDVIVLNQYSKSYENIINMILDIINNEKIPLIYIGESNIPLSDFNHLGKIDFKNYLRKNGAKTIN